MKTEVITTAKGLAYLAWQVNLVEPHNDAPYSEHEKRERFENWWQQRVWSNDSGPIFDPELSVFIDGKRYIRAE